MKILIEIPNNVLEDIEILAKHKNWSRKRFLESSIIKELATNKSQKIINTYRNGKQS